MNERILTPEEAKQINAVIHALEKGFRACNIEEKRLVKRFVAIQKRRLTEYEELSNEAFYKALASFDKEKRSTGDKK